MNRRLRLVVFCSIVAMFLLAACSHSSKVGTVGTPTGDNETGTVATPTVGNKVGNLAPDFNLKDLNGNSVSLSGLMGRPVVLNFWNRD